MRSVLFRGVAVGAAALSLLVFMGRQYHWGQTLGRCGYHRKTDDVRELQFHPSPDGTREVALCADEEAAAYWVTVRNTGKQESEPRTVFLTWEFPPTVSWRDVGHLLITIEYVTQFRESLHQADGIAIVYRLADRLSEETFRQGMEAEQRRTEETLRTHKATFVGDPIKDREFLARLMSDRWAEYRRLKEWAKTNAENGAS